MSFLRCCFFPSTSAHPPSSIKSLLKQNSASLVHLLGLTNPPTTSHRYHSHGLGILIHPSLVLTTHNTVPNADSALDAEILSINHAASPKFMVKRKLLPLVFFTTSPELDLTVLACDAIGPEIPTLPLDIAKLPDDALADGQKIYIMGYLNFRELKELSIGEGWVSQDKGEDSMLFKTQRVIWFRGSAGFDRFGSFSFLVCDPNNTGSEIASLSRKPSGLLQRNLKQWGTPIGTIRRWLEPQWNGDIVIKMPQVIGKRETIETAKPLAETNTFSQTKKSSRRSRLTLRKKGCKFDDTEANPHSLVGDQVSAADFETSLRDWMRSDGTEGTKLECTSNCEVDNFSKVDKKDPEPTYAEDGLPITLSRCAIPGYPEQKVIPSEHEMRLKPRKSPSTFHSQDVDPDTSSRMNGINMETDFRENKIDTSRNTRQEMNQVKKPKDSQRECRSLSNPENFEAPNEDHYRNNNHEAPRSGINHSSKHSPVEREEPDLDVQVYKKSNRKAYREERLNLADDYYRSVQGTNATQNMREESIPEEKFDRRRVEKIRIPLDTGRLVSELSRSRGKSYYNKPPSDDDSYMSTDTTPRTSRSDNDLNHRYPGFRSDSRMNFKEREYMLNAMRSKRRRSRAVSEGDITYRRQCPNYYLMRSDLIRSHSLQPSKSFKRRGAEDEDASFTRPTISFLQKLRSLEDRTVSFSRQLNTRKSV